MIKAITLDFWDTIFKMDFEIDLNGIRINKLNDILKKYNIDLSQEELTKIYRGVHKEFDRRWTEEYRTMTTPEVLQMILKKVGANISEEDFKILVTTFQEAILQNPPTLMDGAKTAIQKLSGKYKLGIISDTGFSPGSKCVLSWQRQLSLFEKGLTRMLEDEKQASAFRALSWGRLAPDERVPYEMSYRLALAAFESPLWDKKRGRAKTGHENNCVVELANKEDIYRELKVIFTTLNRSVRFSSAEKVLVMEAGKLPFFDALKMHGVQAKDRLPFDCQAWFSVSGPEQQ